MNLPKGMTPEMAKALLWKRGDLGFLYREYQLAFKELFEGDDRKVTILSSRRVGKSTTMALYAIEQCIRNPHYVVKWVCDTKTNAESISNDVIGALLVDCPDEVRPEYSSRYFKWRFPNGSFIHLGGADGRGADRMRGTKADLALVDEAGFVDKLDYVVNTILMPMLLTTKGKLIMSSTPPKKKKHEFHKYIKEAKENNKLQVFNVFELLKYGVTMEEIEDIADAVGGMDSENFRREFMCEMDGEDDDRLIPEWTPEVAKECTLNWAKPGWFDPYVSTDLGGRDWTFALFAYYDFKSNIIVIEDEMIFKGTEMTTRRFAEGCFAKERQHFTDVSGELIPPYLRISDIDLVFINDLAQDFGLKFKATGKDNLLAMVNELRDLIAKKRIVINPRCVELLKQLDHGEWNKNRDKFAHMSNGSHCDGIAALIYLIRNVNYRRNPFPTEQVSYVNHFYVPSLHDNKGRQGANKTTAKDIQMAKTMNPYAYKKTSKKV